MLYDCERQQNHKAASINDSLRERERERERGGGGERRERERGREREELKRNDKSAQTRV